MEEIGEGSKKNERERETWWKGGMRECKKGRLEQLRLTEGEKRMKGLRQQNTPKHWQRSTTKEGERNPYQDRDEVPAVVGEWTITPEDVVVCPEEGIQVIRMC